MKKIELTFPTNKFSISGDQQGRDVYMEQVKPNVTEDEINEGIEVIFPPHVVLIASSFVQGFSNEIVQLIGRDGFKKKVTISTVDPEVTDEFYEDL